MHAVGLGMRSLEQQQRRRAPPWPCSAPLSRPARPPSACRRAAATTPLCAADRRLVGRAASGTPASSNGRRQPGSRIIRVQLVRASCRPAPGSRTPARQNSVHIEQTRPWTHSFMASAPQAATVSARAVRSPVGCPWNASIVPRQKSTRVDGDVGMPVEQVEEQRERAAACSHASARSAVAPGSK